LPECIFFLVKRFEGFNWQAWTRTGAAAAEKSIFGRTSRGDSLAILLAGRKKEITPFGGSFTVGSSGGPSYLRGVPVDRGIWPRITKGSPWLRQLSSHVTRSVPLRSAENCERLRRSTRGLCVMFEREREKVLYVNYANFFFFCVIALRWCTKGRLGMQLRFARKMLSGNDDAW